MKKGNSSIADDAQLRAADTFAEPPTLLDIMLEQFHTVERNRTDPFISKAVIAGEIRDDPPRLFAQVLQGLIDRSVAESKNPLLEENCPPLALSGMFLNYETHFVGLFEAVDRYVVEFLAQLDASCKTTEEAAFSNVRVLYFNDDVVPRETQRLYFVDRVPGFVSQAERVNITEDEILDMVVGDVRKLTELFSLFPADKARASAFQDNARTTHSSLFPHISSLKAYLKSDHFLTLEEYGQVFGKLPEFVRDVELNHPVDQPLKY